MSPNAGLSNNHLRGVTAVAEDDVWAVGWRTSDRDVARTLKATNSLYAVDALPSGAVWAVGSYLGSRNGPWRTLIMAIPA